MVSYVKIQNTNIVPLVPPFLSIQMLERLGWPIVYSVNLPIWLPLLKCWLYNREKTWLQEKGHTTCKDWWGQWVLVIEGLFCARPLAKNWIDYLKIILFSPCSNLTTKGLSLTSRKMSQKNYLTLDPVGLFIEDIYIWLHFPCSSPLHYSF